MMSESLFRKEIVKKNILAKYAEAYVDTTEIQTEIFIFLNLFNNIYM